MSSIKRLVEAIERNIEVVEESNRLMRELLDLTQVELTSSYGRNAHYTTNAGYGLQNVRVNTERGEYTTTSQPERQAPLRFTPRAIHRDYETTVSLQPRNVHNTDEDESYGPYEPEGA